MHAGKVRHGANAECVLHFGGEVECALRPHAGARDGNKVGRELAQFINQVPNHISITGHTDTTAYSNTRGYGNWELSADRANAARRALVDGGMGEDKVSRVVGLSSSVLFDRTHPQNPINRRISIVVMTHDAEQAVLGGRMGELAAGPVVPDADTRMPDAAESLPAAAPLSSTREPQP